MSQGQKIGLLFGSFNPIHTGHLIVANFMATQTDLSEVWLVLSPQSPFKTVQELLPEAQRSALAQAAVAGNDRLRVSTIEFELPKPSYTIATLDELRRRHPAQHFVLLMGEDNVAGLPQWKEAGRLLAENEIYVYPRPGADAATLPATARVQLYQAPLLDISATFIRACVRDGKSIRYLVPDVVEQQIMKAGYWR